MGSLLPRADSRGIAMIVQQKYPLKIQKIPLSKNLFGTPRCPPLVLRLARPTDLDALGQEAGTGAAPHEPGGGATGAERDAGRELGQNTAPRETEGRAGDGGEG